jgi:hypothetical protein
MLIAVHLELIDRSCVGHLKVGSSGTLYVNHLTARVVGFSMVDKRVPEIFVKHVSVVTALEQKAF